MTTRNSSTRRQRPRGRRVGIWIFGARGGLATTLIAGTHATARGLSGSQGLLTETDLFADVPLVSMESLVFGGHEVRAGSLLEAAQEIHDQNGTIPGPLLRAIKRDLVRADAEIKPGCLINAGRTIRKLAGAPAIDQKPEPLRKAVSRLQRDLRSFQTRNKLDQVIAVNLTSTEPQLKLTRTHQTRAALDAAIDADRRTVVRPSTLYAYAAAAAGFPFIHFTPSNATLLPAIREIFEESGTPFMGCDGKTGETLVKSALAPMFKYRNLKVLTWQGYNLLGDRDGAVLSDSDNKRAKVESKDRLLSQILGYPLHSHVGIDYVPSLGDLKTAWDFIHFQGFLGHRMSMQFTWHGCDSILAAPIVLDMLRLAALAQRRGESGPMAHLACFFKSPLDSDEHDLHEQWHQLTKYAEACRKSI